MVEEMLFLLVDAACGSVLGGYYYRAVSEDIKKAVKLGSISPAAILLLSFAFNIEINPNAFYNVMGHFLMLLYGVIVGSICAGMASFLVGSLKGAFKSQPRKQVSSTAMEQMR